MSTTKTTLILLIFILIWIPSVRSSQSNTDIVGKVVEIEPVALEVILPIYERVVVLFMNGVKENVMKFYQGSVGGIIGEGVTGGEGGYEYNKTLFAICDLSKDVSGKLKKFGGKPSIQLITSITHYQLEFPEQSINNQQQLQKYFNTQFPQFLKKHTTTKLKQIKLQQIKSDPVYNKNNILLVTLSNKQQIQKAKIIYKRIFDYLKFFDVEFLVNEKFGEHINVDVYRNGELSSQYANSAVEVLFNFSHTRTNTNINDTTTLNEPIKQQINDLINFINIETIDDVTYLNSQNYFRVYGSSIQYQILLVYRSQDQQNNKIKDIIKQYENAALKNRVEGLKYQRILFAVGTEEFLSQYFADSVLQKNQLFSIIITKTDYSSFQLRRFTYTDKQVTSEKLIQFISDVRLKKLDATYKSQEIEENSGKKIRKIVGKNFQHQIFQQAEKSVMVLFIDSKDQNISKNILEALESFVQKYYDAYREKMHIGIFDLSKNQHKLLTIANAPELVLFERTNKKKPKFFKGQPSKQTIKNWVNFQVKDITIPQNFGEPPIALGSPTNTQL